MKKRDNPNNSPADARIDESKPGYKAGNEFIDAFYDHMRSLEQERKNKLDRILLDYFIKY